MQSLLKIGNLVIVSLNSLVWTFLWNPLEYEGDILKLANVAQSVEQLHGKE